MNQIEFGDCRDIMRRWADQGVKVQTCVTSPPYFGLRDYGVDGQIGLEQTPEEYIAAIVEVFRCVRDVLSDDGTLWMNLGDSYGANKNLLGMPWRVALALQADDWVLRQDIIWHKPNPMPESVRDRPTKAHEYLFLLSKSGRYYFDSEAIKEPANLTGKGNAKGFRGGAYVNGSTFRNTEGGKRLTVGNIRSARDGSKRGQAIPGQSHGTHRADRDESDWDIEKRNKRSVWTVATRPFKGSHFATFPPALIEPCVLAGSRAGDVVLDPFMGSGTTAAVALQHGRKYLGCELNPAYGELQQSRLGGAQSNQISISEASA